jgi:hypothetical protein
MEKLLIENVILLDKDISKKLGIEATFLLNIFLKLKKENSKINQSLIVSQTEGFIEKPVTILNNLKKKKIIEKFNGDLVFNKENFDLFIINEEPSLELKSVVASDKKEKENLIEKKTNYIMELLPFQSEELRDLIREFVINKIKKGLSKKACELNAKALINCSNNNEKIAIATVEKTLANGWPSFYELSFNEKRKIGSGI